MQTRESLLAPPAPVTVLAPASFAAEEAAFFRRVLDLLEERGLRFLVGGAAAVNAHCGVWRWTKDLDLFVQESDVPRIEEACRAEGLEWTVIHRSWLAKTLDRDRFVDFIWRGANGLYAVEEDWFARAHPVRLLGRDLLAIGAEDLILGKMFVAARNRFDGADILHVLLRAHHRIDWEGLVELAEQHAGLLLAYLHLFRWAYPLAADAIPATVLRNLAARAARPVLAPPFRALLLDFHSFRADVDGLGLPDPHEVLPRG